MKLRQLVKDLVDHDMDAEIYVHAASGTKFLEIEKLDQCLERALGDTEGSRVVLRCYALEPIAECP